MCWNKAACNPHVYQVLLNPSVGYKCRTDQPLRRTLAHNSPREPYRRRTGEVKSVRNQTCIWSDCSLLSASNTSGVTRTRVRGQLPLSLLQVIHWGQRKLMLSEMELLLLQGTGEGITVVYAGAAPGTHIKLLSELFPSTHFHLYDPAPFTVKARTRASAPCALCVLGGGGYAPPAALRLTEAQVQGDGRADPLQPTLRAPRRPDSLPSCAPHPVQETTRIRLFQSLFTDEVAHTYAGRDDILFLSDVRSADWHVLSDEETDAQVRPCCRLAPLVPRAGGR